MGGGGAGGGGGGGADDSSGTWEVEAVSLMGETAVEVDEVACLGAEVVVSGGGTGAWEVLLTLG